MNELCSEHKNKIQRICLNAECDSRALCLLCDHPHGNTFQSIMVKKSQSYKNFELAISEALDKFVLEKKQSTQEKLLTQQSLMIQKYFQDLRIQMNSFLRELECTISEKLQSGQHESFMQIKKARINRNYLKVNKQVFRILLEIYQGNPISEVFKNTEGSKVEETYSFMKQFYDQISQILEKRNFKLKTKLPDIRKVYLPEKSNIFDNQTNYEIQTLSKRHQVKLIKQALPEVDSILTDCYKTNNLLYTTSYDKKLRIFDKNLNLAYESQFSNILTKIHEIADDIFAIGHSKQVYVQKIQTQKEEFKIENIMILRGHTQKINDIHSLNSRIIGSSSSQCVKIWDLYKQKSEYTLTDQANPTTIRFLRSNNVLAVGFNNHYLKLYEIQTMKLIKKYNLNGVPLMIDQGKFQQFKFYVGGFDSTLFIADLRLKKMANQFKLKQGAVTCISDSFYDESVIATGDRDGKCNILDLRTQKIKASWQAHSYKTNMSKPRGVLGIFENQENVWMTVGCNDKSLKLWSIQTIQNQY